MSPIDPDDLRHLLAAVEPVDTTGAAERAVAEGRRRRRRQRRSRIVACVVLALALLAGALVLAQHRQGADRRVDVLASPTPSPLGRVAADQLPTAADLAPMATYNLPLGEPVDQPDGQWGGSPTRCQPNPQLGQESLRVREFKDARVTVAVVGFLTPADATAARERILGWYRDCARHGATVDGWTGRRLPARMPSTQPAVAVVANPTWPMTSTAQGRHEEAVVVQVGNRLAWLAQAGGGEQNCGLVADEVIGACGAFESVEAVATRLAR